MLSSKAAKQLLQPLGCFQVVCRILPVLAHCGSMWKQGRLTYQLLARPALLARQ